MKKIITIIAVATLVISCKKETPIVPPTANPVYLQVEAVSKNGEVTTSNIIVVK